MTDTTAVETTTSISAELGKAAVRATAQTAVEMAAAVALLAAAGAVINVVEKRRAKKAAKNTESK
jgi:predicted deacylase